MTTTNELGQVRKDYQDGYGRLSKVEEYTGAGSTLYATTTYGYDQQGLLTSIHDNAGNDTEFTFDALERRIGLNDPDAGVLAFSYDGLGRLSSQTDARLQRLDFSYDLASRTTARTGTPFGGSATTLATYAYDAGGAAANALGRRTSMSDLSGSTTYAYDARGRTTSTVQTILGSVYTTGYAYDALDRPTTTTYPDGEQVTTAYGANGLPTTLAGSSTYISAQTYDALGRPLVRTFGSGVTASFDYYDTPNETDHDGVIQPQDFRLRSLTYANGASTLQKFEYRYDRAGNTTKWWETLDTGAVTTWTFGYDDLDRLTSASAANPPGGAAPNFSYSYDALGRITQGPSGTYTYGDPTHAHAATAVGTFSYSYDANGAATSRSELGATYTHSYDLEGRQSSVTTSGTTTSFTYTGDGELVAKAVGGTTMLHVAAGGLYEKDPSTGTVTKYYKLGGALIAVRDTSLHYLGHDHLNSTTLQTSATGAIEGVQWRAPYGESWFSSGALATDRLYTGERSLESSLGSLYDYGARSYDPIIQRFLSPDPLARISRPQSLDPYAYVRGNPLKFVDPSGLDVESSLDPGAAGCGCSDVASTPATTNVKNAFDTDVVQKGCVGAFLCNPVAVLEPWYVQALEKAAAQFAVVPNEPGVPGAVILFEGEESDEERGGSSGSGALTSPPGWPPGLDKLGDTKGGKTIAINDLTSEQRANLARFEKKLPNGSEATIIIQHANGEIEFRAKTPGKVPGSYAEYIKVVDSRGETTGYWKVTVDPAGQLVGVKDKFR